MIPKLVAFDLDGTLAVSKQAIISPITELLGQLLEQSKVAIISGGKFEQLELQVAEKLPETAVLDNLYILPTSGAALYTHKNGTWIQVYEKTIASSEAEHIGKVLAEAVAETKVLQDSPTLYGPQIEYRGNAAVAFSALGQLAPPGVKLAWDPTHEKRQILREAVALRLPSYDVKVGGATTIDITQSGVNKAFGMRELSKHLNIPIEDMVYIGDALFPGGNDEVVKETNIKAISVTDPIETARVIESLLHEASTPE